MYRSYSTCMAQMLPSMYHNYGMICIIIMVHIVPQLGYILYHTYGTLMVTSVPYMYHNYGTCTVGTVHNSLYYCFTVFLLKNYDNFKRYFVLRINLYTKYIFFVIRTQFIENYSKINSYPGNLRKFWKSIQK